jgi:hypothetical protein
MPAFPDVYCWIKLINQSDGRARPTGTDFAQPAHVTVRYVVANDSHKPEGPFFVAGYLRKNGVMIESNGQPVVPLQQITLQPNQVWKQEYDVIDSTGGNGYDALMRGDILNLVDEEDEKNNKATAHFTVSNFTPPN